MSDRGLAIDEEPILGNEGVTAREAAFVGLADRHLDRAYRLAAVLLGSELEAQDAVQDAAASAWARFGDLRDPARFDAWFDRILVNGCRDRLRARRRVRLVELEDAHDPPVPDGTGPAGERDALRRALASCRPTSGWPSPSATSATARSRRSPSSRASASAP